MATAEEVLAVSSQSPVEEAQRTSIIHRVVNVLGRAASVLANIQISPTIPSDQKTSHNRPCVWM